MIGPVEAAVRAVVRPGQTFATNSGRATFVVEALGAEGVVLGVGEAFAHKIVTPWAALEGLPGFLRGGSWVRVGSVHSADAVAGSLDGYLQQFSSRSAGSYVPVVLESAGVVDINRGRPATVRLRDGWGTDHA